MGMNDELDRLETRLNQLAPRWRGADDPVKAAAIAKEYQGVLRMMLKLGYDQVLDMDAELPDEYMPVEYLELHHRLTELESVSMPSRSEAEGHSHSARHHFWGGLLGFFRTDR